MRFPLSFGRTKPLLVLVGITPGGSFIDVDESRISVHAGWWFKAEIDRVSIQAVELFEGRPLSIGVHGWAGRWLVNGKRGDFVRMQIAPAVRAKVGPVPLRLTQLTVSLEDRERFVAMMNTAV